MFTERELDYLTEQVQHEIDYFEKEFDGENEVKEDHLQFFRNLLTKLENTQK